MSTSRIHQRDALRHYGLDAARRQHVITRMVHWFDYRNWDVMGELGKGESEAGEEK